jgi:Ca2+-binding RTX toxin-like protein
VGDGAAVRILGSWVSGSIATERGGALYVRGDATVAGSTVSDNVAGAGGGAWVSPTGTLLVRNATISSNEADRGGGGIHARGTVLLRSATLARNGAKVAGGVMAVPDAVVTTSSSLFDRNSATGRAPTCSRPLTSEGYNVADATGCGLDAVGDLAGAAPLLGGLRQNGGPTPTHALKEGSPAVGNGGPVCPGLDQRGAPRDECDTGAYELVSCLGRPVTIVGTAGHDDLSGGLQRDVFLGRGGSDVFQGSLGEDRACGGRGRDRLIGGPDADRLAGNEGDDVLLGEGGRDLLLGGSGADVCRGGAGTDVLRRC